MGALRVLVDDVDEELPAFAAAGFRVEQRWGPPFAILAGDGLEVWLSGPVTSAAQATAALPAELVSASAVRPVLEVDDLPSAVADLVAAGWEHAAGPVSGPGGSQQLLRRGLIVLEVFAAG
jgi:hypothetical protein